MGGIRYYHMVLLVGLGFVLGIIFKSTLDADRVQNIKVELEEEVAKSKVWKGIADNQQDEIHVLKQTINAYRDEQLIEFEERKKYQALLEVQGKILDQQQMEWELLKQMLELKHRGNGGG